MAEIGPIKREVTIEPVPQTAPVEEPSPSSPVSPTAPSAPPKREEVPA